MYLAEIIEEHSQSAKKIGRQIVHVRLNFHLSSFSSFGSKPHPTNLLTLAVALLSIKLSHTWLTQHTGCDLYPPSYLLLRWPPTRSHPTRSFMSFGLSHQLFKILALYLPHFSFLHRKLSTRHHRSFCLVLLLYRSCKGSDSSSSHLSFFLSTSLGWSILKTKNRPINVSRRHHLCQFSAQMFARALFKQLTFTSFFSSLSHSLPSASGLCLSSFSWVSALMTMSYLPSVVSFTPFWSLPWHSCTLTLCFSQVTRPWAHLSSPLNRLPQQEHARRSPTTPTNSTLILPFSKPRVHLY